MATEIFNLQNVGKDFNNADGEALTILSDVNLILAEGEILTLLGRSGSGKSTLLRIMAGLTDASTGSVLYRANPILGPVPNLAMVFQSFALFPWLTVLENVELGLEARKVPKAERQKRALAAIDLIGLDGYESAYPRELSGGMRQRVGFARALVIDPDVLLMDEPFSALDVLTAETLRNDLLDLWMDKATSLKGILLVSHNIEEAILMADRIVIFGSNPGQVRAEIPVRLARPRDRQSPEFRELVEEIYAIMTARPLPRTDTRREAVGLGYRLPNVSVNRLVGLMEALAEKESPETPRISLAELAEDMHFSVDDLFPLLESLELLGFAQVDEGEVELNAPGKTFVASDLQDRKTQFARHLLERVSIAAHIRRVLDERPSHRAPANRFLNELEDNLSEDEAERVLETAIAWGRYGEVFAYDDNAEVLSLENPGSDGDT